MYNNSDVDNQINKILKGSTPIDKLHEPPDTDSIKKRPSKKKKYIKSESSDYESEESTPIKPKKKKYKIDFTLLKEASILLIIFVLISSKQSILLFGNYVKILGLDDNKDQFILGIITRGFLLVLLYYWFKKCIKDV